MSSPLRRWIARLTRVTLALLFAVLVAGVAAYMFPRQFLTIDDGEVKGDVLVVLGGGDGRAARAAELYRQGAAPRVLVTGFGDTASNIETLEQGGVPARAIYVEPRALSTLDNAKFSLPILRRMGAVRVILVTSWFHSRRAVACFRKYGRGLIFYSRPCYTEYNPAVPNRSGYSEHVDIEYEKLLGYALGYRVWPF